MEIPANAVVLGAEPLFGKIFEDQIGRRLVCVDVIRVMEVMKTCGMKFRFPEGYDENIPSTKLRLVGRTSDLCEPKDRQQK